jgi:hypothetical protein
MADFLQNLDPASLTYDPNQVFSLNPLNRPPVASRTPPRWTPAYSIWPSWVYRWVSPRDWRLSAALCPYLGCERWALRFRQ